MKTRTFLSIVFLFAFLSACKKDNDSNIESAPAVLDVATTQVRLSLDSLNNALALAGASLANAGADTSAIRVKLQQLLAGSSFAREFAYINQQGILQLIEPPAYQQYQGSDLSNDTAIQRVLQSHEPVFSDLFMAMEGYYAVTDMHPAYNGTTSLGAIEGLFTPWELLGRIISPLVSAPNEIWVLAKNGVIVYDPDGTGNGANVFTDPSYEQFPGFVQACHTIVQEESGQTSYTYNETGTTIPVAKKVWWETIHLHANAWKIVWAQEE